MAISLEQFLENLSQTGLLSADEVSSICEQLPESQQPADAQELAKELIRRGKLTKYQASSIYTGKHKRLVFGEYIILDRLGAGGMGVVFKARHRRMDRIVAIKVLPASSLKTPDAVERFYREVKAAARLMHPNIVTAFDAGEHEGMHFLVMEYVDGKDLAVIVHKHGPLGVAQAVECIVQAARGLEYAHAMGIIHRDIKPANLLLHRDGTVKILDMGLALLGDTGYDATTAEQLTGSGQIMGTVDYMSPEQAQDTHRADERSDVYSLGCTLHRLLTGVPPYQGSSVMNRMLAHREDPIPSLRTQRADVPMSLDAVFARMIAKYPADRPQTMGEVVAELEASLSPEATANRNLASEPSSDSALSEFFHQISAEQVGTKSSPTTAGDAETIDAHTDEAETGKRLEALASAASSDATSLPDVERQTQVLAKKEGEQRRQKKLTFWLTLGGCVASLSVLLGIIFILVGGEDPPDNPKPKGGTKTAITDVDREVAEWVRGMNGSLLGLEVDGKRGVFVKTNEPLPQQKFLVVEIILNDSSRITASDFERLKRLSNLKRLRFRSCPASQYWQRLPELKQLTLVELNNVEFGDGDLKSVCGIRQLTGLTTIRTRISDEGLRNLSALTSLRGLTLHDESVTGAGFAYLKPLTKLNALSIQDCPVTDKALKHLDDLSGLRTVSLIRTRVTAEGYAAFKSRHPRWKITWEADPNREVAQWVLGLSKDSFVTVQAAGSNQPAPVKTLEQLPAGPFQIVEITQWNPPASPKVSDLRRLATLPALRGLNWKIRPPLANPD